MYHLQYCFLNFQPHRKSGVFLYENNFAPEHTTRNVLFSGRPYYSVISISPQYEGLLQLYPLVPDKLNLKTQGKNQ